MRNERASTVVRIIVAVLLTLPLPMGYVVSIGPAARLVSREQLSVEVFSKVYAPMFFCRRSAVCNRWLESCMDLWLGP
jgi:hypothetical protein